MYEKLTKTLEEKGEKQIQIKKAYVLHLGFFVFNNEGLPYLKADGEFSLFLESKKTKTKLIPEYEGKIIKALEKHPNVFDLKKEVHPFPLAASPMGGKGTGVGLLTNFFSYKLKIPKRQQTYSEFFEGLGTSEELNVVSCGSLFGLYTLIKDYPVFSFAESEFRDFFKKQIQNETDLIIEDLNSTYLRSDIITVIKEPSIEPDRSKKLKPTKSEKTKKPHSEDYIKRYRSGDDVIIVTNVDIEPGPLFLVMVEESVVDLLTYCRLAVLYTRLKNIYSRIINKFVKLSNFVTRLCSTKIWDCYNKVLLTTQGRKTLSGIHSDYVDFSRSLYEYEKTRDDFLNGIEKNKLLLGIKDTLESSTAIDIEIPGPLNTGLKFFEGEFSVSRNIYTVIFAAIAGAIIVGLLTVIAMLLT